MKKIIDGKVYDTEKSTELYGQSCYSNGNYCGSNSLYVTKSGNLFVCYSSNGQDLYRSEDIHAMDQDEAKDWLSGREITDDELAKISEHIELDEA